MNTNSVWTPVINFGLYWSKNKQRVVQKIVNTLLICAVLLSNVVTTASASPKSSASGETRQSTSYISSLTNSIGMFFSNLFSPVLLDPGQPDPAKSSLGISDPVPANGADEIVLTTTVRDVNSDPVSGVKVVFSVSGELSEFVYDNEISDASGVVTARIKSEEIGPKPVTAYIVGATSTAINQSGTAIFTGGVISGTIYEDKNNNGQMDSGEDGVVGITVTIKNQSTGNETNTVSLVDGSYIMEGLAAGIYQLTVNSNQEYGCVTPVENVNLANFEVDEENNFGLYSSAMIAGSVYNDFDQDRVKDAGESGIGNVSVTATGPTNSESSSTDENGLYELKVPVTRQVTPPNFTFDSPGYTINNILQAKVRNGDFEEPGYKLAPSTFPDNYNFETPGYALDPSTYPTNYNFESGTLGGWETTSFHIVSGGHASGYAAAGQSGSIISSPFTIPSETQSISWWFKSPSYDRSNFYLMITQLFFCKFKSEISTGLLTIA
jgi:hypothetical protein